MSRVGPAAAFWSVAAAFATIQVGGTLISPLFPIYQQRFGFSALIVTVIFGAYALSVIAGLVVFGSLSDGVGRRPVLLLGLGFEVLSTVVFLVGDATVWLFVGRVLAGIAGGIFAGTATATLVDLDAEGGRATTVAGAANVIGLGLGPLIAGVLAQVAPAPLRLPFWVLLGLTALVAGAIVLIPETLDVPEHPSLGLRLPALPPEVRPIFLRSSVAILAGGAMFGLFTAVAPSFLVVLLHQRSHALEGAVLAALCASATLGQVVLMKLLGRWAQAFGSGCLLVGMAILAGGLALSSLGLVIVSGIIAGAGYGMSFGAGLRAVNAAAPAEVRGGVDSSVYIVLFGSLAIPAVLEGVVASVVGTQAAAIAFSIAVAIIAAFALLVLVPRSDQAR